MQSRYSRSPSTVSPSKLRGSDSVVVVGTDRAELPVMFFSFRSSSTAAPRCPFGGFSFEKEGKERSEEDEAFERVKLLEALNEDSISHARWPYAIVCRWGRRDFFVHVLGPKVTVGCALGNRIPVNFTGAALSTKGDVFATPFFTLMVFAHKSLAEGRSSALSWSIDAVHSWGYLSSSDPDAASTFDHSCIAGRCE